ncbi:MAG: carbohydrate ABC transporter permease [Candidatus Bipolaricaulota bacterium]
MTEKIKSLLARGPLHIIVITIGVVWLIPTFGLFMSSFRPARAVANSGWWTAFLHPLEFTTLTLNNYQTVITKRGIGQAFINSLSISVPAVIIPILVGAFAAYALAWMDFRGREVLFTAIVGLLVIPLQMTLIPILRIFDFLGLAGTFPGVWLAHSGYGLPLTIYLLHNFIAGLPSDLFDSAEVDGATELQKFTRIVLPLSTPAIASVVIFQFIWVWNDLLVALIYLGGSTDVAPLTVQLTNLVGTYGQNWELLTAAAFVSMLLPLAIFFSLQRYFVRGLTAGAVKG